MWLKETTDSGFGNIYIAQRIKFSIKDFFSKCDQIPNGKLHFLYSEDCRYPYPYRIKVLFLHTKSKKILLHFQSFSIYLQKIQFNSWCLYFFVLTTRVEMLMLSDGRPLEHYVLVKDSHLTTFLWKGVNRFDWVLLRKWKHWQKLYERGKLKETN